MKCSTVQYSCWLPNFIFSGHNHSQNFRYHYLFEKFNQRCGSRSTHTDARSFVGSLSDRRIVRKLSSKSFTIRTKLGIGIQMLCLFKGFQGVYFGNPKSKLTLNINFEFVQTCYICKVKITAMKASYSESFKALVCQNCYKNATIITFTVIHKFKAVRVFFLYSITNQSNSTVTQQAALVGTLVRILQSI